MFTETAEKIQDKLRDKALLVAVTKGRSVNDMRALADTGIVHFGENKVQEAAGKIPLMRDYKVQFHMIGHLQTNKVRDAVILFDMIQSVDSLKLLRRISEEAAAAGKCMPILLQINVSKDPKKYGIPLDGVFEFLKQAHEVLCAGHVFLQGLMTIVENTSDAEDRRIFFGKMKSIFDDLKNLFATDHIEHAEMKYLSMGMSDDYEIALEEGANMVRIGRALFLDVQ